MGQIIAVLPGIEAKLDDLHGGIAGIQLELTDFSRHEAQIFRNEIQMGQGLLDGTDEGKAGTFDPAAVSGGLVTGRHSPVAFEATEMIEANHIIHLGGSGKTLDPPKIAGIRHLLPVVNGIAPELAVFRKGIGGTASHHLGTAVFIQLEQLRRRPYIGGIQRHVNGHITDDADTLFVGVSAEGLPLAVKLILQEILEEHVLFQFFLLFFQSLGFVVLQFLRPIQPGFTAHLAFQSHEDGVIRQPGFVFLYKDFKSGIGNKAAAGNFQHLGALVVYPAEIHPVGLLAPGNGGNFLLLQQPLFHQGVQVDEIVVARAGGEGLVGGIPVAGGGQRQDLPVALTGGGQEIHKPVGAFSHGADAVGTGQGRDMH